MASNITRDHHNLRRNLNLNGNYISNDGGDEGIRISDAGLVGIGTIDPVTTLSVSGAITIKEQSTTPSADGEDTYGQIWIKNTDPTELWFTNDDGDDIALTGGSLLATASRVMANDISQGDAAVSIGTDTGNITFKDNSDAEWLTFNISDVSDVAGGANVSEILGKNNQRLRLRSVGTQVPLQLASGSSVYLSQYTSFDGTSTSTGSIIALKSPEDFSNDTCDWSSGNVNITHDATTGGVEEATSDSALNSQIHVGLKVEAEEAGLPGDGVLTTSPLSEVASVASATGFAIDGTPTASATDETVNFRFPHGRTILSRYSGTITAEWVINQNSTAVEPVSGQTAIGIPAQLRGSTSGVKATFVIMTNSVGQPSVRLNPSTGGSGYNTPFDDNTCVPQSGQTSITHADDSGAIKQYMAVYGTGIPVGAYVATRNSDTEFTLSVAATAGDDAATVKLTFYDRVCIQDPHESGSNYAVVEVSDAKDGIIAFGQHTTGQMNQGSIIPRIYYDFNEAKCHMHTAGNFRIINGFTALDTDFLSFGGSRHTKKSGQSFTFVHAGDRMFFGSTLCNSVSMAIDSSTTTKRIWLAASNLTNGTGRLLDTTAWRAAGGLEIATEPNTGATTFTTRVEAGETANEADMTLTIAGDLEIQTAGTALINVLGGSFYLADSGTSAQLNFTNSSGDWTLRNVASNKDIIFNVNYGGANKEVMRLDGSENSLLITGDCTIDRNTALTATGTARGLYIDYDHVAAVADGQTLTGIGLDLKMNCNSGGGNHANSIVNQTGIDLDLVASADGTQTNTGIDIKLSGGDRHHGLDITVPDGLNDYHLKLMAADDINDFATIRVADTGDLTIATAGSGTTNSHMTLDVDGDMNIDAAGGDINLTSADVSIDATKKLHLDGGYNTYIDEISSDSMQLVVGGDKILLLVEDGDNGNFVNFKTSCAGFTKLVETFSDDSILTTGGTDDTHIDFRHTNKISLAVTGAITNLNLIFPPMSGNFLLLLTYDGDHTITNYKVYEADETAADGDADVFWPGGTKPDNTASGVDILSFFYDASTGADKCYGVASLAFATP